MKKRQSRRSIYRDLETSSKPLWDIPSIITTMIPLVCTAIFFIAGWIYEGHWYAYFGINLSQIELNPTQILVRGIPGILFFALSIIISFIFVTITGNKIEDPRKKFIFIIIFAYIIATFILAIPLFSSDIRFWGLSIIEVQIAFIPSFLIWAFAIWFLFNSVTEYIINEMFKLWIHQWINITQSILTRSGKLFSGGLRERFLQYAGKIAIDDHINFYEIIRSPLGRWISNIIWVLIIKPFWTVTQKLLFPRLSELLERTWQITVTFSLFFLFLLSLAVSALMGEYEARHGSRWLDGNWRISPLYISSDKEIQSLSQFEVSPPSHRYGPLGLIASNTSSLFLVDWKDWTAQNQFTYRPNLFVIPKNYEAANVQLFIPAPTFTPTPTPTSTFTPAPLYTKMPVIQITPTPNPSMTVTLSPSSTP